MSFSRFFGGVLIMAMAVCSGQAAATTVTSTIRVTATTVQTEDQARAVQLGGDEKGGLLGLFNGDDGGAFDPNKLPSTASGADDFSKISRLFEIRIQLTPGYPVRIALEGNAAKQWEYRHEKESVIVVSLRPSATLFKPLDMLTIAINY